MPGFSTADFNTSQFGEFFDRVNFHLMVEFFGIDTAKFWDDYYAFCEWREAVGGTFREWWAEKTA